MALQQAFQLNQLIKCFGQLLLFDFQRREVIAKNPEAPSLINLAGRFTRWRTVKASDEVAEAAIQFSDPLQVPQLGVNCAVEHSVLAHCIGYCLHIVILAFGLKEASFSPADAMQGQQAIFIVA